MDTPEAVNPLVDRFHRFQSELIGAYEQAWEIIDALVMEHRELCAGIVTDRWIEPISYALMIRDKGFSMEDEISAFRRHDIPSKAQMVLFDLHLKRIIKTESGKAIADLIKNIKRH
jgi:hypothetical protein